jgi:hypothetical protein
MDETWSSRWLRWFQSREIEMQGCTLASSQRWVFFDFTQRQTIGATREDLLIPFLFENQLSQCATLVVIAADVLEVLSLDAHFFAVVVQANAKSV